MRKQRLLTLCASILLLAMLLSGCLPKAPEPSVTKGRFNFSVTYEVNGEVKTIAGVYVCEFVKVTASLDGSSRVWKGYIENSDIKDPNRYEILTNDDGVIYLDLGFVPSYFMSDPFYDEYQYITVDGEPQAYFFIVYHDEISEQMGGFSIDEELLASYGVRVISCEYDEPIANEFLEEE